MKITDLKENQVVHCTTHEEAERVLRLAHEAGMKWGDGSSYFKNDKWYVYKDKTCYNFTSGSLARIRYYKSVDFEIIPSEKITDMENKTEFFEERVMEVSGDGIKWNQRVVFGKKNGKYISWSNATTVEDAKIITRSTDWDYAREIDPFREVKEAYERGEVIQTKYLGGERVDTTPVWLSDAEYRIKPKPKYVPFTYEDAELFMNRVVIAKDKSCKAVITYSDNEDVLMGTVGRNYKHLFERFTFMDGSPCGKEVKE